MSVREASQRPTRSKAREEGDPETMESESTLRRLQARGERLLQWFPELRKTWQRDAEPSLEALVTQLQSLGGEVSRRAQETGRDLEARAERLLTDLERQAVKGLGPILSRANLASGSELSEVETRLHELEARLPPIAERADRLESSIEGVCRTVDETRAEATERLREITMRLAAGEELQQDVLRVHDHIDALSKEQVGRSLEIGKLHDRLVRLEMRMGDVLKEQSAQAAAQRDVAQRVGEITHDVGESTRGMESVRSQIETAAADGRATDARLTALMSARSGDHDELTRLADLLGSIHHTLRQVDLRLGDLGERYAGVREELASLAARVSHLELAPTQPVSATLRTGRTEGH